MDNLNLAHIFSIYAMCTISTSTQLIGDNRAADILSREDMVTPGNRWFYIKMFNFVKERIGLG